MTARLPQATGLKIISGLSRAKGIDIQFTPSLAIIAGNIDKLGVDIRSFRVPLKRAVKEVMIPSIRKNFDAGGRPAWTPLADATIERKGNNSILINSGALRRQMGYQNIWTITKDYAIIQDLPQSIWYGKVHQAGADIGASSSRAVKNITTGRIVANVSQGEGFNIPARPFVVVQPSDERGIESVFRHWLDERVKARLGRL
jgi:phage gpG-like protein